MVPGNAFRFSKYLLEVFRVCQPDLFRISRIHGAVAGCRRKSRSDAKLGTALGATRFQYCLATPGFHPGAKTMGALAFQIAGLIRSFHVLEP